jgi:hypothetical protein
MLTVKNKSYKEYQISSLSQRFLGQMIKEKGGASVVEHRSHRETRREKGAVDCLPFRGLGILGSG